MKKMTIFLVCLLAALAIDFLREGLFAKVYAQLQKNSPAVTGELRAATGRGSYPAPDPAVKPKEPYPVSGKPDPAAGPYPPPGTPPKDKKAGDRR